MRTLLILVIIYLSIDSIKTICSPGYNCPLSQGFCNKDQCICLYGFDTFYNETDINNQIYCNYRRTNRFIPLVLEFLLPSTGLFLIQRDLHALIKLFLFFSFFGSLCLIDNFILVGLNFLFKCMYFVDLLCLIAGVYKDGNGMPLL